MNSLAHWLGDATYDDRNSPRDHVCTALITLGEGYHNFHHEFPSDYRNAILWYQYDPTKWMIWSWKQVGLAHNLRMFRQNEIEKGKLQQQQKKLDLRLDRLQSSNIDQLPVMGWTEYQDHVHDGRSWIAIAGVVLDVSQFAEKHPGGKSLIESGVGKDATAMFYGGIYNRESSTSPRPSIQEADSVIDSQNAHRMLNSMHVGIILGGSEVEVLKANAERVNEDEDEEYHGHGE